MKPLPSMKWLVRVGGAFTLGALAWSLFGLLTPTAPPQVHEYSLSAFVIEVGGHLLWGFAAGLFTLDPAIALLVTGESVLIDIDHLFAVLSLPVEPREAHSVFFAVTVALVLASVGKRGRGVDRGIFFGTLGAIAGHFSYDIFAGYGLFPVLSPFSNAYVTFPFWAWPILEAGAVALCVLTWFPRRRQAEKPPSESAAQGPDGQPGRR